MGTCVNINTDSRLATSLNIVFFYKLKYVLK